MTLKLVGWFALILIILLSLYNLCESHAYVEYRIRWTMSPKDRYEYKKKRFCSLPVWFLVLLAIGLTFLFNKNEYTTYGAIGVIALYALFIFF